MHVYLMLGMKIDSSEARTKYGDTRNKMAGSHQTNIVGPAASLPGPVGTFSDLSDRTVQPAHLTLPVSP